MSLINDALKRAKQAQQENPPPTPPLEFRPVETGQQPQRRTTVLVVGLALVIVALLGLAGLLVWFVAAPQSEAAVSVAARVVDPPLAPLAGANETAAKHSAPPQPVPAIIERPDEPNTNGYPVAAVVEPAPQAPLKLQGIFFNPQNPSAVVNGRSVYLGDRVNGFRVQGISPVAVTLASATETNVLSLSGQ